MVEERFVERSVGESFDINVSSSKKRSIGEEEWSIASESLAREWGIIASELSIAHNVAAKKNKCKHHGVGLPAILVPICMAPLSATFAGYDGIEYANMVGFLVSGCLSATHSFFGFERKYQQHMDFSARYSDICTDVKYELSKSRKFRISSDQFLMRIQMKLDNLGGSAPDL